MERRTDIIAAKKLFGKYFFGPDEINSVEEKMNVKINDWKYINFDEKKLYENKDTHILLYGINKNINDEDLNISTMRKFFQSDPRFYNQDWYLNEKFVKTTLDNKWYLLKKDISEDTRGYLPSRFDLLPSVILSSYTFFLNYFINNEILWKHDFIWNSDMDHNGDRIYCGRYVDPDKINNNGFNIHRYLTINKHYGSIFETN